MNLISTWIWFQLALDFNLNLISIWTATCELKSRSALSSRTPWQKIFIPFISCNYMKTFNGKTSKFTFIQLDFNSVSLNPLFKKFRLSNLFPNVLFLLHLQKWWSQWSFFWWSAFQSFRYFLFVFQSFIRNFYQLKESSIIYINFT